MNQATHDAMRTLIRHSALENHPHLAAHINFDTMHFDFETLNEWNWSSGELVLLGVLQAIYQGHSYTLVSDLFKLDEPNRQAVLIALRIRLLGHADPMLTELSAEL